MSNVDEKELAAWRASLEPTDEEFMRELHADELPHYKSGNATPDFVKAIKDRWRSKQFPPEAKSKPERNDAPPSEASPKQSWSAAAYKRRVAERKANKSPSEKAETDDPQAKAAAEVARASARVGQLALQLRKLAHSDPEYRKAIQELGALFAKRAAEERTSAGNLLELGRRISSDLNSPELQKSLENMRRIAGLVGTLSRPPLPPVTKYDKQGRIKEQTFQEPLPDEEETIHRIVKEAVREELAKFMEDIRKQRDMENIGRRHGFTPIDPVAREETIGYRMQQGLSQNLDEAERLLGKQNNQNPPPTINQEPPPYKPTRGELIGLILALVGLILLFFVAAPAAAGVFDMNLARALLIGGWIACVVATLIMECLYRRTWKRRVITTVITAITVGAGAFYAHEWITRKKAEQNKAMHSATQQQRTEGKAADGNVFLSDKYPAIGDTKKFTFFGIKNYGVVTIQARFGLSSNFTIILLVHSTEPEPGIATGDCLIAINNYQAIVDDLKAEAKKRSPSPEVIDFDITPNLICHYDYATDISPEASKALKQIALRKNLVLSIEGPRGPR